VTAAAQIQIDDLGYLYPLNGRPEDGYYVAASERSLSEFAVKLACFSDVQAEYADIASAVFELWRGPTGNYFRARTANPTCDFGARTAPKASEPEAAVRYPCLHGIVDEADPRPAFVGCVRKTRDRHAQAYAQVLITC
jgi:hypothetical protein